MEVKGEQPGIEVFRWVDCRAQAGTEEMEIQQKVKDRWGLNASDTCMCSGSVEGGQKKPLTESQ